MSSKTRDHGGGLDAAIAKYGGTRSDWVDLSTGINPVPYPIPDIATDAWSALPDQSANDALLAAARRFWNVPDQAAILAAPGASALIAKIPSLFETGTVTIQGPTYNEHAAAFRANGWDMADTGQVQVVVHPNNPDGRLWRASDLTHPFTVIDESFCDVAPAASMVERAGQPGTLILKSFGKFWGLAGLRLGFAIGQPEMIKNLTNQLGPWAVSGPALTIGAAALRDAAWTMQTRERLAADAAILDSLMADSHAKLVGGTTLFRLYHVDDAIAWQDRLAQKHVWSRVFPYSQNWLRLGLPAPNEWDQLRSAL